MLLLLPCLLAGAAELVSCCMGLVSWSSMLCCTAAALLPVSLCLPNNGVGAVMLSAWCSMKGVKDKSWEMLFSLSSHVVENLQATLFVLLLACTTTLWKTAHALQQSLLNLNCPWRQK